MDAREEILASLPAGKSELPPVWVRTSVPSDDLWEEFWAKASLLGVEPIESLEGLEGLSFFVAEEARAVLDSLGAAIPSRSEDVWTADVGITLATRAVAESGTLLLEAGPGGSRMASLSPPIHIVLVSQAAILSTLDESVAQLRDRTSVWVSGPSRTADIAGILVRGIHGPKQLKVWVY